ncbi:MAG: nucleotidyl transferase AbiEii/AbiGii toxin family protein [Lachnospiraceae bacterium]|nr:nucleotidyl transferase AbiEii/AbiGii toxin family protein [Lachnospiraceae bacterium]
MALIDRIHDSGGYRRDVLEKDYYVCLVLEELSIMQKAGLPAYFKGGTALYKALKTTRRFSEDIDLSVDGRDCSRTQNDKRLAGAVKKYTSLVRNPEEGKTNRSEVISVYHYEPLVAYDSDDVLQRFGKLKVEATSFTISEPVEELEIAPILYEQSSSIFRDILSERYAVRPFSVLTISMERIFIDKLFAAESYVRKSDDLHRAFEAAKHIYDLAVLYEDLRIRQLTGDEKQMKYLLGIRMEEEMGRLDGIPGVLPSEFILFWGAAENRNVQQAYEIMQKQYVFRESDRIPYEEAARRLKKLGELLNNNPVWYGKRS